MLKKLLMVVLIIIALQSSIFACTIIAVGKDASADGSVIISHTDTGEDSRIFVVPAQTFKKGAKAPVYWGIQDAKNDLHDDGEVLGYIPQVEQTYKYFQSAYSHINEYQLGIGESTTTQREELTCTKENSEAIMTIEQAQIFALQRFKEAKPAVKFIGELMTEYGFLPSSGDGSECLVIADTEDIWVFECFGVGEGWKKESGKPGAIWAAQRLPRDKATMIPNWSIIKEINVDDTENFMVSDNYMQAAIDRGWYDLSSGKAFNWQATYAPTCAVEYATSRFWLFHQTFVPNLKKWPNRFMKDDPYKGIRPYYQEVEPLSIYPFAVKPEEKISVQDVMKFQRSTFEGTIYDMTAGPEWLVFDSLGVYKKSPLATPFPSSDLRTLLKMTYRRPVARHRGHYGMVIQLRNWLPDAIGGVYWVYLDNPYFSPYVPIYAGNLSVDESYNIYNPEKYDEKSARWAIDFVDNLANLKFQKIREDVWAVRNPWEEKMFADQEKIEKEAAKLYQKSPKKAQQYLTDYSNTKMQEVTKMFLDLRNEIIVKYTNNHE